jgi:hypothetical protein
VEEIAVTTPIHKNKSNKGIQLLILGLLAAAPLLTADSAAAKKSKHAHDHAQAAPAKLVEIVRNATQQYADVNAARAANYQPFLGCISGPDHGAMGVHYVNGALVGDGEIDEYRPEALIYEPSEGRLRLVGVEYIVDAATWMKHHKSPPVLEGQAFQLVSSPNRYGLPTFFELHVWAWRGNPNGSFVDWNTRVSCEGQ